MRNCKLLRIAYDLVPMPFGAGNCTMETAECSNEASNERMDNIAAVQDIGVLELCGPDCPYFEEAPAEDDGPDFDIDEEGNDG